MTKTRHCEAVAEMKANTPATCEASRESITTASALAASAEPVAASHSAVQAAVADEAAVGRVTLRARGAGPSVHGSSSSRENWRRPVPGSGGS